MNSKQRQKELQREQELALEKPRIEKQCKQRKKVRQAEKEKITMTQTFKENREKRSNEFDPQNCVNIAPEFSEEDPDDFFRYCERIVDYNGWLNKEWSWLLQPKLKGKASLFFTHLDSFDDYDFLKSSILDAYYAGWLEAKFL